MLTHTVGLPAMPREITPDELPDWSRACESLAAAEPRWRPGAATGYHSYTFAYLVGELARRATGRHMCGLLREWITAPLGIEGQLYFATPEESLPGLARLGCRHGDGPPPRTTVMRSSRRGKNSWASRSAG